MLKLLMIFLECIYRIGPKIVQPSAKSQKLHLEIVGQQKEKIKGLLLSYPGYVSTTPAI